MFEKKLNAPKPTALALPAPLETLIKKARKGDESVMPQLRQFLDSPQGQSYSGPCRPRSRHPDPQVCSRQSTDQRDRPMGDTSTPRRTARLRADHDRAVIGEAASQSVGWTFIPPSFASRAMADMEYRDYWQGQVDHPIGGFWPRMRLLTNVPPITAPGRSNQRRRATGQHDRLRQRFARYLLAIPPPRRPVLTPKEFDEQWRSPDGASKTVENFFCSE